MNEEAKTAFTPGPMISFRNAKKLSSYLVRAKLYPIKRTVESFKCNGKSYQTCLNVIETDTLTSTTTGETYKINHQFSCNSKCLVYFLTCKVCLKQYVGQTVQEFRLRWNSYKSNDRKYQKLESCMQQHRFEHFNSEGCHYCLDEISITFIDKTDPSEPLKTKNYRRSILKTMTPLDLDFEDSV